MCLYRKCPILAIYLPYPVGIRGIYQMGGGNGIHRLMEDAELYIIINRPYTLQTSQIIINRYFLKVISGCNFWYFDIFDRHQKQHLELINK